VREIVGVKPLEVRGAENSDRSYCR